jgi:hypothetical protein
MSKTKDPGLMREIFHYMKVYKKWWMLPIIVLFIAFGILLGIAQYAPVVSPFIYTLF